METTSRRFWHGTGSVECRLTWTGTEEIAKTKIDLGGGAMNRNETLIFFFNLVFGSRYHFVSK
jgi:hypothetical protein